MAILPNFDDGHMSKTEISAKILKRKKIKVFIIRITPKAFQLTARVRSFIQTKHETNR